MKLVHWQVFGLKREVEIQRKRRLEVEAEIADKKVAQLSSKLENVRDMVSLGFDVHTYSRAYLTLFSCVQIDGKWFLSKLGLNPNKTQVILYALRHIKWHNLRPQ